MPETPCLFGNQTAVFLKCAEIDCALESAKKPRTAGLCGRAAGACDCGPLSCSTIERVNKGQKPPEQGMVRRKNTIPKGSFLHRRSRIHTDFSHIAHKRRNTRFNGLWRVHTPPQPLNAHTAAHRANGAGKRGAALRGTFESTKICAKRFQIRDGEKPREQNNSRQTAAARQGRVDAVRHAQPGRCCFRSRECFSLAVPAFVPTASSPAPAAVPVPRGIAARSRGDSCRSAVDSIPPSCAAGHPARLR